MKMTFYCLFFIVLFSSCTLGDSNKFIEKPMEIENGYYIVSKRKYPDNYRKLYKVKDEYIKYRLITAYGLRIVSDYNFNVKEIYVYDRENGIQYVAKNMIAFADIVNNKIPSETVVFHYQFCAYFVNNLYEVLDNINNIFINKNIKFIKSQIPEWDDDYDKLEVNSTIMCTCLGG